MMYLLINVLRSDSNVVIVIGLHSFFQHIQHILIGRRVAQDILIEIVDCIDTYARIRFMAQEVEQSILDHFVNRELLESARAVVDQ